MSEDTWKPFEKVDDPAKVPENPIDKPIVDPGKIDSNETWKPFEPFDAPPVIPDSDGDDVPVPPNSDG